MRIPHVFVLATFLSLIACQQNPQPKAGATSEAVVEAKQFGEAITAAQAITFDELLGKMSEADSLQLKVAGKVNAVCQVKGCWMTIASDTNEDAEMVVKFKDYGFFVPKDISGRTVIMEGHAFREVTSVEELRHYAEDEGQSPEEIAAITEPEEELKFIAHGVLLMDE